MNNVKNRWSKVIALRKARLGFYSVLTAFLFIVMSCVNVSAGAEVDLGDIYTTVNDIPGCEAEYVEDGALEEGEGNDHFILNYTCPPDGKMHFFVRCYYEDNHGNGSNTGKHTYRISPDHQRGGTPHCPDKPPDDEIVDTDAQDEGEVTISITWDDSGHFQAGDTILFTITASCEDVGSIPPDTAETQYTVLVTLT